MRLGFYAFLIYMISASASAAPTEQERRYRAATNSINYGNALVGIAGLVVLEDLVKIDSLEYKGSATIVLGQIDQRLAELAEASLSNGAVAETTQLTERKMAIIENLILRGGRLPHYLNRYIRNSIGAEQADGYFAPRIVGVLMNSGRTAEDRLLVGSIVKIMNIAQRAIVNAGDPRQLLLEGEPRGLYSAVTELIIKKHIKDLDLLTRMSRILKAFKIPRHELTSYIARLHGKSCGQLLSTKVATASQNDSAAGD